MSLANYSMRVKFCTLQQSADRTHDHTILFMTVQYVRRRSVGRMRDRTAEERVWISGRSKTFFASPKRPDQLWGPQRILFKWMPASVSLVVKWPERATNHSSPGIKVKNVRSCTLMPTYAFMACTRTSTLLITHCSCLTDQHTLIPPSLCKT